MHAQVSSGVGEVRSAKRGGISVQFLPETDGLGGFKDRSVSGVHLLFGGYSHHAVIVAFSGVVCIIDDFDCSVCVNTGCVTLVHTPVLSLL